MNGLDLLFTGILVFGYMAVMYSDSLVIHHSNRTSDEVKRFNRAVLHAREVEKTTLTRILVYGCLLGATVGWIFDVYFAGGTFVGLTIVEYKLIKYKASLDLIREEPPPEGKQ